MLINKDTMKNTLKYCDYVLHTDNNNNNVTYVAPPVDPRIQNAQLMKTTGDVDFLSRSLGYIYLSAQRNKLLHGCLLPSMLVHAVKTCGGDRVKSVEQFNFIHKLFHIEFIFDPDNTPQEMFESTLNLLTEISLVTINTTSGNISLNLQHNGNKEKVEFLLSLLQPFFDAYTIVAYLLPSRQYEFPLSFKTISQLLQLDCAGLIRSGGLVSYESLSLHTLSNVITSYCKNKLLGVVKNASFETLVSGVEGEALVLLKGQLMGYVSDELRAYLTSAKL